MPRRSRFVASAGTAMASLMTCALLTEVTDKRPLVADPVERQVAAPIDAASTLQLAFAGDVHFEGEFDDVPSRAGSTLGPMSRVLSEADFAMVNLESAVTRRTEPTPKEREDPADRYWFRTSAAALELLERSGVDAVSVANNHGADFGLAGLVDTLQAADRSGVAVLGAGYDEREAFAPYRVSVRGTDLAIHAADASPRESADDIWAAGPGTGPGLAAARGADRRTLAEAVRASARTDDLVIVYLHWGEEGNACSTRSQESTAQLLEAAGADIVVGTHAHTPLGAGMRGATYVSYGLGNFYWYHGRDADSGVLRLTVQGDDVVADEWVPGRLRPEGGGPRPLAGRARATAVQQWERLRRCTDLAPGPGPGTAATTAAADPERLPAFTSSISRIGRSVRLGMRGQHTAACPVPLADLRHLVVTHVGFDGRARRGELIVHEDVASDVVGVFSALYAERFRIRRMRLIDVYDGDDNRSMAANNTSGYNCRRVAGQSNWSDHAFGRAIDINPVQNPYVTTAGVQPPAARRFVSIDRSADAPAIRGLIRDDDVVRREFERIGWEWGGFFADPDFQHFSSPEGAP